MSDRNDELNIDDANNEEPIDTLKSKEIIVGNDSGTGEDLETNEQILDTNNIDVSQSEDKFTEDIQNTDSVNVPTDVINDDDNITLELNAEKLQEPLKEPDDAALPSIQNEIDTPDIDVNKDAEISNESEIAPEEDENNMSDKVSELFLTDSSDKVSNLDVDQDTSSHLDIKNSTEREENIKKYKELMAERAQLTLKNSLYHKKLAEYYKKRKVNHVIKDYGDIADKEKYYHDLLLTYEKVKNEDTLQRQSMQDKLDSSNKELNARLEEYEKRLSAFQELEKTTANGLVFSATGKRIPEKLINRYLSKQTKKLEDRSALRLENIHFKNLIQETEAKVRKLNKLGEGLCMSDYERLLNESQTLMKKLDERDEKLARLRNLCKETNHILAHIKEEMHCQDEKCSMTKLEVLDAERQCFIAREKLTKVKQKRDKLKSDLQKEYSNFGLLAHQHLLVDYEATLKMVEDLRRKKPELLEEMNILRANVKSSNDKMDSGAASSATRVRPRLHHTANLKPSIGDCYFK